MAETKDSQTTVNETRTAVDSDTRLTQLRSRKVRGRRLLAKIRKQFSGRIYFIKAGEAIKIGFSTSTSDRLSSLQVAHPEKLQLLGDIEGTEAEESRWHAQFRHLHIRGEWFRAEADLAREIRKALGQPEPKPERQPKPGVPMEWLNPRRALIQQRNACNNPVKREAIQILIEQIENISVVGEEVMRGPMARQTELIAAF